MNARLRAALEQAIGACRREAARIRAALPEEDGAPDAPPRQTPDGLWESDAEEWDEDARQIESLLGARLFAGEILREVGRPARVAEERTTP